MSWYILGSIKQSLILFEGLILEGEVVMFWVFLGVFNTSLLFELLKFGYLNYCICKRMGELNLCFQNNFI